MIINIDQEYQNQLDNLESLTLNSLKKKLAFHNQLLN